MNELTCTAYGPRALLITCPTTTRASVIGAALRRVSVVEEAYVAYDEVLVSWRSDRDGARIRSLIAAHAKFASDGTGTHVVQEPRQHRWGVVYDGADLAAVAAAKCMSASQAVALHSSADYTVVAIGFQPGFAYLAGCPAELALPRKNKPRTAVPAGSVAIANDQSAVYPHVSPGGWHLLGRVAELPTAVQMGECASELAVGDHVRFVPKPAA